MNEERYDNLFVNLPSVFDKLPFDMKRIVARYSTTPSASKLIKTLLDYSPERKGHKIKLLSRVISHILKIQNPLNSFEDFETSFFFLLLSCFDAVETPRYTFILQNRAMGLTISTQKEMIIKQLIENEISYKKTWSLNRLWKALMNIYTYLKNIKTIEEDNKKRQIEWKNEKVSYKKEINTLYKPKPSY
jgi:uncharacterized lipoprotein YehR (DUF1307 family)